MFYNILETQESTSVERNPVNVDIYNLISNLKITTSRLKRTKFIFWKFIRIFSSPKIAKNII